MTPRQELHLIVALLFFMGAQVATIWFGEPWWVGLLFVLIGTANVIESDNQDLKMKNFKPMLSATVDDVEKLRFPLMASPKLDGVRAIVLGGKLLSRNLKLIPNEHCQFLFGAKEFEGLDGELILGDPCHPEVFRRTQSATASHDGQPDVVFHVFDKVDMAPGTPFEERLDAARGQVKKSKLENLAFVVPHTRIAKPLLEVMERESLDAGFEGLMLRDPKGLYKFGRSTFKEHGLMKLKRFADAEAKIVGFEEQMHNANEAVVNALGAKERSAKKAGMVGKDTLGALKVVGINGAYKGVEFNIGTGFDDAQRAEIWAARKTWLGKTVTYKFFPSGSKVAPRFPVFKSERKNF